MFCGEGSAAWGLGKAAVPEYQTVNEKRGRKWGK
jgi:hypothetical protein